MALFEAHPDLASEHLQRVQERRQALSQVCAILLGEGTPFVWEIGCGHGHFLTSYAASHHDQLCIGIDIARDRVGRAERKRERAGLRNLHFLRADARDFLVSLPGPARIAAVYILFPDPWPKRRHHKHRLLEPGLLDTVAARAGQGTRLYFRTDYEPYYAEAVLTLRGHPAWRLCPEAPWLFEMPTIFQQKAASYHSAIAERV